MIAEGRFPGETGEQRIGGQRPVFTGTPQQAMTGEALARAGAGVVDFATTGLKIEKDARDQSDVNAAMSESTRDLDNYTTELEREPDYKTREAKFAAKADEIRGRFAEKLSGHGQLMYDEQLRRRFDTLSHTVRATARKDEVEAYTVNMDAANEADLSAAMKVKGTPKERILLDGIKARIGEAEASNIYSKDQADKIMKSTLERYDTLKVQSLIRTNPAAAIRMADPENTPNLRALDREKLKIAAQERMDKQAAQGYAISSDLTQSMLAHLKDAGKFTPDQEKEWGRVTAGLPARTRAFAEHRKSHYERVGTVTQSLDVPQLQAAAALPPVATWQALLAATEKPPTQGPAAAPGAAVIEPGELAPLPSISTVKERIAALYKSGDAQKIQDAQAAQAILHKRIQVLSPDLERDLQDWQRRAIGGQDVAHLVPDLARRAGELGGEARAADVQHRADTFAMMRGLADKAPAEMRAKIDEWEKDWTGAQRPLETWEMNAQRVLSEAAQHKGEEFAKDPKSAALKYNEAARESDEIARGVRPLPPPEWDEAGKSDAERRSEHRRAADLAALKTQADNGVLPTKQRITSKPVADQYAAMFANAKGVDDKRAIIENLRGQYREDMFPRVMAEIYEGKKIPGDITLLSNIPAWAKAASLNAVLAYRGDVEKMRERAGGKQAGDQLERDLIAVAAPILKSFDKAGDPGLADSFMDGMKQMGTYHMASGMDSGAAAAQAYKDALGAYNELRGTTRIPVVQGRAVANPADVAALQDWYQQGGGLKQENFRLPPKGPADAELTDKERWPIYLENIRQGMWLTTADQQGYGLFTKSGVPVFDNYGKPFIIRFDEKPNLALTDAARSERNRRSPQTPPVPVHPFAKPRGGVSGME